jgi:hypothetical protein
MEKWGLKKWAQVLGLQLRRAPPRCESTKVLTLLIKGDLMNRPYSLCI